MTEYANLIPFSFPSSIINSSILSWTFEKTTYSEESMWLEMLECIVKIRDVSLVKSILIVV